MISTKTLNVGKSEAAPFVAFGDESIAGKETIAAYAYVVLPRSRIHQVEGRLRRLKRKFKIPEKIAIHCRQLMAPHQREKLGLTHLTSEDARSVVGHAITLMNESRVWVKYAWSYLPDLEKSLGRELVLRTVDGNESHTQAVNFSAKAVTGFLAYLSMILPTGPQASQCQIFASEERTRSRPLFGDGPSQRVDKSLSGFTDIGASSGSVFFCRTFCRASRGIDHFSACRRRRFYMR